MKYCVISLPRTGTTSICAMADILKIKNIHRPFNYSLQFLNNIEDILLSDTPMYSLKFIKKYLSNNKNVKVIYLKRPFDDWWKSFCNLKLPNIVLRYFFKNKNTNEEYEILNILKNIEKYGEFPNQFPNIKKAMDIAVYLEIFKMKSIKDESSYLIAEMLYNLNDSSTINYVKDIYESHFKECKSLFPENRFLSYSFKEGWKPLCNFLNKNVPNEEIPHLNKSKFK